MPAPTRRPVASHFVQPLQHPVDHRILSPLGHPVTSRFLSQHSHINHIYLSHPVSSQQKVDSVHNLIHTLILHH